MHIEQWEQIKLGIEEHGFVCGATGTGKSKLSEFLVNDPDKSFSVVYDPKHSRTIGEWHYQTYIYSWEELTSYEHKNTRRIVYRPPIEEAEDVGAQKAFFQWIFEQGHVRVYVDECSALLGDSSPNFWFKGCLTRGRELGISVVAATQRPVSIPLITLSEATRFYLFRLNLEEDMKRMEKITGIKVATQMELAQYQYYYYDASIRFRSGKLTLDLDAIEYQYAYKSLERNYDHASET